MAEDRKVRLDYDPHTKIPEGTLSIRHIEEALGELFGGEWSGRHRGRLLDDAAVFSRFSESPSGRKVLTGLLLLGDATSAIKGETLRKVPVARMENSNNLTRSYWEGDLAAALKDLPPLRREAGMSAEQFSQLVAKHYEAWAPAVPSPAAAIAAEWGVKSATVHSWIREARLRGYLPPARQGRQG
ncbi:hypothetical protein [Actinoplanes teichomyceticus]|uniref:Uncharacterized protein n=1 Tax=Actinoplanes teichomyceticus TaxID=1867 RepID=A0A561WI83_ACTTI|nr:hypothetical protein [Actinoplanes teichomyceticus]TWG23576.1 hypothetical protein FHX34_102125 [Actinoplanes teichomyceticus]